MVFMPADQALKAKQLHVVDAEGLAVLVVSEALGLGVGLGRRNRRQGNLVQEGLDVATLLRLEL